MTVGDVFAAAASEAAACSSGDATVPASDAAAVSTGEAAGGGDITATNFFDGSACMDDNTGDADRDGIEAGCAATPMAWGRGVGRANAASDAAAASSGDAPGAGEREDASLDGVSGVPKTSSFAAASALPVGASTSSLRAAAWAIVDSAWRRSRACRTAHEVVATRGADATITDSGRSEAAAVTGDASAKPAVADTPDPDRRAAISAAQAARLASASIATAAAPPDQPPPAAVEHMTLGVSAQVVAPPRRTSRFASDDAASAGALACRRSVAATW